jgi:hypothetical protein
MLRILTNTLKLRSTQLLLTLPTLVLLSPFSVASAETITGHVAGASPISSQTVHAYDAKGTLVGSAKTTKNGFFLLNVNKVDQKKMVSDNDLSLLLSVNTNAAGNLFYSIFVSPTGLSRKE